MVDENNEDAGVVVRHTRYVDEVYEALVNLSFYDGLDFGVPDNRYNLSARILGLYDCGDEEDERPFFDWAQTTGYYFEQDPLSDGNPLQDAEIAEYNAAFKDAMFHLISYLPLEKRRELRESIPEHLFTWLC